MKESISTAVEEVPLGPKEHHRSKSHLGNYGSCSNDIETEVFRVRLTPVIDKCHFPSNGKWSISIPTVTSWCNSASSLLPICSAQGQTGTDIDESDRHHDNRRHSRDLHYRKTDSNMGHRRTGEGRHRGVTLESDIVKCNPQSLSSMIWSEVRKQAEKFADADMQLAGLI